jgi:hypothetical protein
LSNGRCLLKVVGPVKSKLWVYIAERTYFSI